MPKGKKWTMPRWMQAYAGLITNTGGNRIDELMNDDGTNSNVFNNAPRALICVSVKAQVALLEQLHDAGFLPAPREANLIGIFRRQRHALQGIAAGVELVAGSRQLPAKLRPGMEFIVQACKRGLGV